MGTNSRISLVTAAIAILGLAGMVCLLLALVGRPLATADLWFHLKMGEWYVLEGLWPTTDPMLHTNGHITPVQHEWLFGVAVHSVERALGFQGLRIINVLAVILIIGLVFDIFRRQAGGIAEACLGTGSFVILSWLRLMQDRPDRWSIVSLLLLYRLVLEPGRQVTTRTAVGALLLMLLWANAHSLFAIGLALIGVAMVGRFFESQLLAQLNGAETSELGDSKRLLWLLLSCTAITLLNPRGIWQHLTFFTSSTTTAVWAVTDEWLAFYPWSSGPPNSPVLPWLTWLVADIIIAGFIAALAVGYRHLKRHSEQPALKAFDPTLMLLGIVSIGAALVSFRFLWLLVFPMLFILRVRKEAAGSGTIGGDRWIGLSSSLAAIAVCGLLLAWPTESGAWSLHMSDVPMETDEYLSTAVNHRRYAGEGAAFIKEAGLQGNLFNNYTLGAYLGYQLSPKIRTFIDGRAEHYPPEVMIDYDVVTAGAIRSDGRHYLDILNDRKVDLFYGVGGPGYGYHADNTLHHLEAVPWWTLIFRSAGHGIWVRTGAESSENLQRVASYYANRNIPFSAERGLDVGAVIRDHTQYAIDIRLIPGTYPQKLQQSQQGDLNVRLNALAWLGDRHRIAGDYSGAIQAYQQILQINPNVGYVLEQTARCLTALGQFSAALELLPKALNAGAAPETLARLETMILAQEQWRQRLSNWPTTL